VRSVTKTELGLLVKAAVYRVFAIATELLVVWLWFGSATLAVALAAPIVLTSVGRTAGYWLFDNIWAGLLRTRWNIKARVLSALGLNGNGGSR
jgi:Predicted membrane protein (DUF2061)